MSSVYHWRIWCVDDQRWVYGYGPTAPTECYDTPSGGHSTLSVQEMGEYSSGTLVKIVSADTPPNKPAIVGYKRMLPIDLKDEDASPPTLLLPGNGHTSRMVWYSPPYPVNLYGISSNTSEDQEGDIIDLKVNENTAVGALTAPATSGDSTFNISPTVWENVYTGFDIALYDMVSQTREELGECIEVNTAAATITTEVACEYAFPAATTVVQLTLHPFPSIRLGKAGSLKFGEFDVDASRLEPNTKITISYTNNHTEAISHTVYLAVGYGSQNVNV